MTQRSLEQIPFADGGSLPLSIAVPDTVVRGGILVGPAARGVTDGVWRLATGLATEGWLAVIPHLFHRDGGDELLNDDDAVRERVERLTAEGLRADTGAALQWLAGRGVSTDRIGVVGFGLGGAVALMVATQYDLGAAVTVGGIGVVEPLAATLPALVDIAPELRCPWLGIYPQDGGVPEDDVHKLRDAAHSARIATDLVYCRFSTDHCVAPEAWGRTMNWFDCHLR
jgi:carboxymethylenebutenolidase